MPIIQVKGVANPINFPDDMDISDIREVLRNKFTQRAISGESDILSPQPDTIKSFEPSLADKIGSGIASGLTGTGLISDNYRAQQIGKNVSALAELLPGIGDATAGDEFGRAVAQGDKFGMAMAGLGVIPVAGDLAKSALKVKFPDFKIGLSENADNIILDKIVVPDELRGSGKGTEFMVNLIADADRKGKSIGLTPSSDFGGNKKRLTEFYKRFGFVENKGKNKDFTVNESMIRAAREIPIANTNQSLPIDVTVNKRTGDIKIESENGKVLGSVNGDSFVIGGANIKDKTKRGKGEGKKLYLATIDEAKKRNLKNLVSDESVTPDAARVWESLKKEGLPVVKNKNARFIDDKNGGFWAVDNDLPVYTIKLDPNN